MRRLDDMQLAVVRSANDAIRLAATAEGVHSFLCECGDPACTRVIELTLAEYDLRRLSAESRILHPSCVEREALRPASVPDRLRRRLGRRRPPAL